MIVTLIRDVASPESGGDLARRGSRPGDVRRRAGACPIGVGGEALRCVVVDAIRESRSVPLGGSLPEPPAV